MFQHEDFNPRSPCGERQATCQEVRCVLEISIHAPRVGSDGRVLPESCYSKISIHAPRVGSDEHAKIKATQEEISIHAPRVGSD